MAVALFVKSESGDYYLDVWDAITPEELEEHFLECMECYQPICEYMMDVSGADEVNSETLREVADKMHELSWKHDDNEEDDQIPW